jgi:hypothetical protein
VVVLSVIVTLGIDLKKHVAILVAKFFCLQFIMVIVQNPSQHGRIDDTMIQNHKSRPFVR